MTKKEILEFLELPGESNVATIRKKLEEKIANFEHLSEKAPSEFLRKLNRQNLEKAKGIQKDSSAWLNVDIPVVSSPLANESSDSIIPDHSLFTTPIIVSSSSRPAEKKSNEKIIAGWLVRHTENQSAKTFPLYPGKNYFGRKENTEYTPLNIIENDPYVSRLHGLLLVQEGDTFEFFISDLAADLGGTSSRNGIFVNGDESRITEKIKVNEGDTIQLGETKLVLKINQDNNIKKVVQEVEETDFVKTVVIKRSVGRFGI